MEYNGYTNYFTWLFQLYEEDFIRTFVNETEDKSIYEISLELKDYYEELLYLTNQNLPTLYNDILRTCLNEVNYYELVEQNKEDLNE